MAWNSKAASQRATSPKKNDHKRLSGGNGGGGGQERGRQGRASREGRGGKEADFDLADALRHIVGQVSKRPRPKTPKKGGLKTLVFENPWSPFGFSHHPGCRVCRPLGVYHCYFTCAQDALKEQLLAFERGIELQARRKELGIACQSAWPPHMMFCGNPGTGKTTVARLVGRVLQKLGVLKKGHLVEVQRADLVAGAIGQTALKTRERLKEAQGGVLFVDEAYALAPGGLNGGESKDFGREAINEIMAVMNDGDPVVIFAGYAQEMQGFVRANAGLFRRIDVQYDFANYSCAELATILRHEVASGGFALGDVALGGRDLFDAHVAALLDRRTSPQLRAAMNGGLARQLFRKARGKLDAELSLDASPEAMTTLTLAHFAAALDDIAPPPPAPP